mmetsp:Transcript_16736/g.14636  ORF Transcript_16736/g.14636 Transcript_16736/m.14636 type:complete len:223 (-) Transcript_16736:348-1016(-)
MVQSVFYIMSIVGHAASDFSVVPLLNDSVMIVGSVFDIFDEEDFDIYINVVNYDATIERARNILSFDLEDQINPVADLLPDGQVFMVYASQLQDNTPSSIYGMIINGSDTASADDFRVNGVTDDVQDSPTIQTMTERRVLVSYRDVDEEDVDFYVRIYDEDGQEVEADIKLTDLDDFYSYWGAYILEGQLAMLLTYNSNETNSGMFYTLMDLTDGDVIDGPT